MQLNCSLRKHEKVHNIINRNQFDNKENYQMLIHIQAVLVKLLQVSFNIEFTTILQTTYKYVILVKDKVICHLKKDA